MASHLSQTSSSCSTACPSLSDRYGHAECARAPPRRASAKGPVDPETGEAQSLSLEEALARKAELDEAAMQREDAEAGENT